ncbi:unnamed protein product [Polarella glacialis]|uniref:Uncharacterized protein n=1 Tax=Polarella glacialis TaxID=89957 RepID=A0A813K5X9_POLGL|nr:unnamed protein product [Polarella glacialis]
MSAGLPASIITPDLMSGVRVPEEEDDLDKTPDPKGCDRLITQPGDEDSLSEYEDDLSEYDEDIDPASSCHDRHPCWSHEHLVEALEVIQLGGEAGDVSEDGDAHEFDKHLECLKFRSNIHHNSPASSCHERPCWSHEQLFISTTSYLIGVEARAGMKLGGEASDVSEDVDEHESDKHLECLRSSSDIHHIDPASSCLDRQPCWSHEHSVEARAGMKLGGEAGDVSEDGDEHEFDKHLECLEFSSNIQDIDPWSHEQWVEASAGMKLGGEAGDASEDGDEHEVDLSLDN